MSEKFTILAEYIKDISSETPSVDTYLYVKDIITQYNLNIFISSQAVKNNLIEVDTKLTYKDPDQNSEKKAYFEINYVTVVKISEEIKDKKILEKILLCEVQKEIYPRLERALLNLIHDCGFSDVKFGKKIDFEKLYKEKFN